MEFSGVKNKRPTCKKCQQPFQKKSRGWKRRRRSILYPGKSGFYCERCFWHIAKTMSPSKKAASNTKEHRKRSDHKSVASASPQTKRQQLKCAFCGKGEDATKICGKLFSAVVDGKSLAAHHKCMQYSPKLTQWTFENFGGFKIKEVQNEIRRGNKLTCHACKCRTLTAGGVKQSTSATAGCAWQGCHKTFHFYCAAKGDMNSRRKRPDKKGTEYNVFLVFCCDEHKERYIRSPEGCNDYSASEPEEDNEKRPDASSSDGQSLTQKSSTSASVSKRAGKSSEEGVQASLSEDGGEEENESEEENNEEDDDNGDEDDEEGETKGGNGKDEMSDEEDRLEIDHADENYDYDDIAEEDVSMDGSTYNPYKSLSTSSDSSDSDAELSKIKNKMKSRDPEEKSGKQKNNSDITRNKLVSYSGLTPSPGKETPALEKNSPLSDGKIPQPEIRKTSGKKCPPKPNEKSPKSDKRSPKSDKKSLYLKSERKKPEVLIDSDPEGGHKRTSDDSNEKSDWFDNGSNEMEIADRIKMTPRGTKGQHERHEEGAGDSLPAKARRRLHDASEDSASQGFTSPTTTKKKKVSNSEMSPCTSFSKHDVEAVTSSSDSESTLKTRFTKEELFKKPWKVGNVTDSKKMSSHDTFTAKKALVNSGKTKCQKTLQREDREAMSFTSLSRQTDNSKYRRSSRDAEEDSSSELPLKMETPAPRRAKMDGTRLTVTADVHDGNCSSMLPECVLVIPVDHKKFQTVAAAVRSSLAEKYSVDVRHVHDWTSLAPLPLPEGCMYHYYNNIAIHLRSRDWAKLGQLLIDGETIQEKFQHEYLQQVQLYEQGDESNLLREFVNTAKKMLAITFRKVEERFMSPVGKFSDETQEYLALAISDTSDPDKIIRTKLHAPANLFEWKRDTDFDPTFGGYPPLERMQCLPDELAILQAWLSKTVTHVFQSICIPDNVDMQLDFEREELDAFSKIKIKIESLQVSRGCPDSESATDPVTVVLLFHKLDKKVLTFEHYLERVFKRYIDENKARHIICIIPSCNFKGRGCYVNTFVDNSTTRVKVSSAFDPTQQSVMFIIMEITTGVNT